jgi:hypothetical protein
VEGVQIETCRRSDSGLFADERHRATHRRLRGDPPLEAPFRPAEIYDIEPLRISDIVAPAGGRDEVLGQKVAGAASTRDR